jgi:PAS domain S-box-containing protein
MTKYRNPNPAFQAHVWRNRIRQRALDFRRSLAEMRARERRFRDAIHFLPIPIGLSDFEGRVLAYNQVFTEVFGYTIEDTPTVADWLKLAYPDETYRQQSLATWQADIELATERHTVTPARIYQITCKDGRRCLVEIVTQPAGDLLATTFNDVTARKQAEQSQRLFKSLVENSSDAIGMSSPEGQHYYQNEAFSRLFGEIGDYPPDTIYVDREVGLQVFATIMAGGQWVGEVKMYARDKSIRDIFLRAYPNVDDNGKIVGLVGIHTDVTERRRAENELRESEKRFRVLFENAGVGVAQGDSNTGRFLKVNQKYGAILGYSREEMENINFQSITYPDDLPKNLDLLEQLKRGEIPEFTMEKRYIRKDGTLVWVLLTVSPLWNPGEPPSTHITVVHDITEQKRVEYALRYSEAQIRKLNTELERRVAERTLQLQVANKELEAFAYSVSHDLRAPLRAIDGFLRILINEYAGELSAEARELLDKVRFANQNMSHLVDALLGLSRMSRTEIRRERTDLSLLARSILEALGREHPNRDVDWLVVDQAIADGDSRLLRVVLENLLGNAWKFTSKREHARIEFGAEKRNGETVYFVRDNGAGFDSRYADKLFGAFQRLHRSDEFEGTGIGLATVQRIIHRHGGRIWAESELGKGATFYFVLG